VLASPWMKRALLRAAAPACALLLLGNAKAGGPTVDVSPATALADAPLRVAVARARPGARVTLEAKLVLFGTPFRSQATFVARGDGTVVPARDPSLAGTYRGVDAMGLFWSMLPQAAFGKAMHAHHGDPLAPQTVVLTTTSGGEAVRRTIARLRVAPSVRRIPVRERGIVATFFSWPGPGKRPAVIVLGGAEGGMAEDRAALVASHGFDALALAYFGLPGLPSALADVPIETVQDAIRWLARRPDVDPSRIALFGGSKGAELALVAAAASPEVRAVVAFAPSSVVFEGLFYKRRSGAPPSSWTYRGIPLPYVNGTVPGSVSAKIDADIARGLPVSFAPEYLATVRNATNGAQAVIPVERIRGPVLLVSGDDDRLWPSSFMAASIVRRLRANRHGFADVWLRYPHAGHRIGEAYDLYGDSTRAHLPRFAMDLGGSAAANARASADAWPRVIRFLRSALAAPGPATPQVAATPNLLPAAPR
jgi:dienelactone hydrolase